jgi:hypothetical protein
MTTPTQPNASHSDIADALLLLLEIAGWFGAPFVSAIARTVRTEYPHLIATMERALNDDAPAIGPTPPTRESGQLEILRRRAERLRRRFGR